MKVCAAHVADLAVFNENIHKYLSSLNGRLQVLEVDNARYREAFGELETHVHSRSSAGLRVKLSTTYADNSGLIATTQTPKPKESFVYMASDDDDAFDAAAGEVESQVEQTTVEGLPTPANTVSIPQAVIIRRKNDHFGFSDNFLLDTMLTSITEWPTYRYHFQFQLQ